MHSLSTPFFASQVVGGEHAKGGTSLSAMIDGGQPWRRFFNQSSPWLSVNHGLQLQGLGRGGCISLLLNWVVQNNCCWNLTKRNNFIRLCNIFYNLLCFPFFPRTFGDNLIYTDWQRDNYFRAVKVFPSLAPILLIGEQDHSTLPNHDHFTASLRAQRTYIYMDNVHWTWMHCDKCQVVFSCSNMLCCVLGCLLWICCYFDELKVLT